MASTMQIKDKIRIINEDGWLQQYKKVFHIWKAARKLYAEQTLER